MSLTPLTFTGVSKFSQDFQTIINRAVSIASLPVKALQNQQTDLVQQKLLVSNLSDAAGALGDTLAKLGSIGQGRSLEASSSDSTKVLATNVNSSSATTYTFSNISSIARIAAETSVNGYADATTVPVSTTGSVKLTVGSKDYPIDLTGVNNLTGLRDAINQQAAGVSASILTTGTGNNPYYLSVTANTTGATTLTLKDDPNGANTDLLTSANQGANTVFKINGVPVSKTSNYITDVVPGVTFNILGQTSGTDTVTVSLSTSRSQISGALQELVNNYNALSDQVNAQVGKNAGLLSGDSLVRETQSRLRQLTSFQGTGSVQGLADLGVEFDDQTGKATFNQTTFNALSDTQIQSGLDYLGSSTTGLGGLVSSFTAISDPVTGLAKLQQDSYTSRDKTLSDEITTLQGRISDMQTSLASRLQAADAILANLQSQQSMLDATIQSLDYTAYGKPTSTTSQ
jgi:flagellar hook-associated protein 2